MEDIRMGFDVRTLVDEINNVFNKSAEMRLEVLEQTGETRIAPLILERFVTPHGGLTSSRNATTGEQELFAQVVLPPEVLARHAGLAGEVKVVTHDMKVNSVELVNNALQVPVLKFITPKIKYELALLQMYMQSENPAVMFAELLKKAIGEAIIRRENIQTLKLLDTTNPNYQVTVTDKIDKSVISNVVKTMASWRVFEGNRPTLVLKMSALINSLPDATVAGDAIASEQYRTGMTLEHWGCKIVAVLDDVFDAAGLDSSDKTLGFAVGSPKYVGRYVVLPDDKVFTLADYEDVTSIRVQSARYAGFALLRDQVRVKLLSS